MLSLKKHFLQKLKTLIDHTIYFKDRNRLYLKYIIIKKITRLYFTVLDVHTPGSIFKVKNKLGFKFFEQCLHK